MPDEPSTVTADDVGLPVVDSEGNQIGVVSAVAGDEVEVDPDPDVTDDARASLGWAETENVRRTLRASVLERVSGADALETLPKYDLDHPNEVDGTVGPVFRVDLAEVNRQG